MLPKEDYTFEKVLFRSRRAFLMRWRSLEDNFDRGVFSFTVIFSTGIFSLESEAPRLQGGASLK